MEGDGSRLELTYGRSVSDGCPIGNMRNAPGQTIGANRNCIFFIGDAVSPESTLFLADAWLA